MSILLTRPFRALAADERGSSIIEFAIAVPMFAIMVVGVADLSRGFSERYALQQAANRTLELAHLGTEDPNYDYLIPEAKTAARVAGKPEPQVELQQWLECDGARMPFNGECQNGQQIARYVTLTIRSTFEPAFGGDFYPNKNADGTVPISADASLRVQ